MGQPGVPTYTQAPMHSRRIRRRLLAHLHTTTSNQSLRSRALLLSVARPMLYITQIIYQRKVSLYSTGWANLTVGT